MDTPMWWAAEEPNPVLPHTAEIIVGLVAFLLLLFILRKYVFPRFEQAYQARVDKIEGGIKRAEEAQAEANSCSSSTKPQLAEARTEAARIRDDARADAEGIRQEVLAQAREESDRIIAAGREPLRPSGRPSCASCAPRSAPSRSSWPAGSSASRSPTRPAARGTVERFLAELESSNGAGHRSGAAPAGAR